MLLILIKFHQSTSLGSSNPFFVFYKNLKKSWDMFRMKGHFDDANKHIYKKLMVMVSL